MRYVRFAILALFIVVVLIPATLYGVAYFLVNSDLGRDEASARVAAMFPDALFVFDDVEIGARPVDLHVHGLKLGPKQGDPFGTVEHLAINVDPRSLLGGATRIEAVRIEGFDVRLEFDDAGALVGTDVFRRPGGAEPAELPGAGGPSTLRDLVLSGGTLRLSGPGWGLRLAGVKCVGRLERGTASETDLACEFAGGEVRLARAESEQTFLLGASRANHVILQRSDLGGDRLVLDGIELTIDGAKLAGSLTATRALDTPVPTFSFSMNGVIPPSLAGLLTGGEVDGAVTLALVADGNPAQIGGTLERLAVDGSLRVRGRQVQGFVATDIRFKAVDREITATGDLHADDVSSGSLHARNVDLRGAFVAQMPEGSLAALASAGCCGGSDSLPPVAPQSVRVHIDRLSADDASGPRVGAEKVQISDADLEYAGLSGKLTVRRAEARQVTVAGERLDGVALRAELGVSWPDATLQAHVDIADPATRGQTGFDVTAKTTMERDGLSFKLPFSMDVNVADLPGQRLVALLPAGLSERTDVEALLQGVVRGMLRLEGDLRHPKAVRLVAAELRVPREKDIVTFGPATNALEGGEGPIFVDARTRRVRVGTATLAWSTERVRPSR